VGARHTFAADFASLQSIRDAAPGLPSGIDVLVNNAGVYLRQRRVTKDGYEATFQINHLSHFLLTSLLLPSLAEGSRILNVSSMAHARGSLDFDDLMSERGYSAYGAYSQSKLANILFTRELARRQAKATANALHPGVVGTKLLTEGFGFGGSESLEEGAATSVYLATSDEVKGVTGKYFSHGREARPNPSALDDPAAQRLWDVSARLTGVLA
jgi:NAD(P)-dependent dehydrogenase (short-subunit alcohol dehydrogenase family)